MENNKVYPNLPNENGKESERKCANNDEKCECEICRANSKLVLLKTVLNSAENAYNAGYNRGVELASTASVNVANMAGTALGATVQMMGSSVNTAKDTLNEKMPTVTNVAGVAASAATAAWGAISKVVQENYNKK